MITSFKIGDTYECRAYSNYDMVYQFTVVSRTAKFVTFRDRFGETRRVGVWESNGVEWASPYGKYANSATISAASPAA
jgi:hypothetical protein